MIVRYWEHWSGKEAEDMAVIVKDFNDTVGKEKGIYVEYLSQSNIDQKVILATAAGIPPDIAGLWDKPLPQWAALDALEPLDDLAAEHGITAATYKPVYWKACHYGGKLVALLSTPNDVALIWNKAAFQEQADALRAAHLDPTRAPRTLDELNRYAAVLTHQGSDGRIASAGYLPTEPGWYTIQTLFWFGGRIYDEKSEKFVLTSPETVAAYEWIASYSKRLGAQAVADFHSSLGTFASANNPFLTGQLAMEQQGPWISNYVEMYKPEMNRWHGGDRLRGVPEIRQENCEWGAAPFPSPLTENAKTDEERLDHAVTWCGFDALAIPRGSKHKREAFEFIAYVNQQAVMEKLCALHCKGTPLATHSKNWYTNHPNPYAEVFDRLASSPNAVTIPECPIWPQVGDDLLATTQRIALLEEEPRPALEALQNRLQSQLDRFRELHPSAKSSQ